jgi:hypothetical protein
MPGRPNYAYQWRLATGSQLWRLNQLGRLQVVDDAVCLSAAEAKARLQRRRLRALTGPSWFSRHSCGALATETDEVLSAFQVS